MKKRLTYFTDGFLSAIIGALIGAGVALIAKPDGLTINVNTEFLGILLAVLAVSYLLFRLKLKTMQLENEEKQGSGDLSESVSAGLLFSKIHVYSIG